MKESGKYTVGLPSVVVTYGRIYLYKIYFDTLIQYPQQYEVNICYLAELLETIFGQEGQQIVLTGTDSIRRYLVILNPNDNLNL